MTQLLALTILTLGFAPGDVTEITSSTTLDPSKTYGSLVIKASNVTIDGRGATLLGATSGHPRDFKGTAILAQSVSNVKILNIKAKGFETGLHIKDSSQLTVENCDFSDNFHDPDFGWGENGRRGGILLERCKYSDLRNNRANRVWDACSLIECIDIRVDDNDFSHTSNTGLKLWQTSRCRFSKNNLSYGLRIKKGEVHARDSTGVLIESGSDDNEFTKNDVTHGGDGIFIRVLNGWVSKRNVFTGNDVSYANNNGFEAWSPENTYINNKANHCSYGFWLGASDKTYLKGNEASFNGDPKGFHNSPHLPGNGHAGIVFMFGPSSHTTVIENRCVGNNGAGIALIGDATKFKAYHWIIEGNTLESNRWGIYARFADWITLARNSFQKNTEADFSRDASVTNVFELASDPAPGIEQLPSLRFVAPETARVGEKIRIQWLPSREPDNLRSQFSLGDGKIVSTDSLDHTFTRPGFFRVGLTVTAGPSARMDWRDLYILDDLPEIEIPADRWTWSDPQSKVTFTDDTRTSLVGNRSIRAEVKPYGGGRVNLVLPVDRGLKLQAGSTLVFWVKTQNQNIPGWQGPNPVVTLHGKSNTETYTLTPKVDRLAQPVDIEAREGWTRFEVPIQGARGWDRSGTLPSTVERLSLGFDSWGGDPLILWIDGLAISTQ